MDELVGKKVTIKWKDGADWHWFKLIGFSQHLVKLNGLPSPDGAPHRGPAFYVPVSDIESIQLGIKKIEG